MENRIALLKPLPFFLTLLTALFFPFQIFATEAVQWRPFEITLTDEGNYDNPWVEGSVTGTFNGPSGEVYEIPGFWDGGDTWRIRFTPTAPGLWTYTTNGSDGGLSTSGDFTAEASPDEHGFIRAGASNPYIFEHSDGASFFWMGVTNYGLIDIVQQDYEAVIAAHRAQNFNNMRIEVEWDFTEDIPFEGADLAPDHDRIDPAYFAKLDSIFDFGLSEGMTFELLLFNYYDEAGLFHDPPMTDQQQENYLKYIVARYSAYANLALWTIANEYEIYPNGKYITQGTDVDWAKARATFIRGVDPYTHLIGAHPFDGYSLEGEPIEPGGTAGDLFGDYPDIDVLIQQHYGANSGPDVLPRSGDAAGLEEGVAYDRVHNKPVMNLEYGYSHFDGRNNNPPNNQQFDADYLRRGAWRIVISGGFLAAGFDGTSLIKSSEIEVNGNQAEADQYGFLYSFFTDRVNWVHLTPDNSFILSGDALGMSSGANEEFPVYLPNGGSVEINIDGESGDLLPRWIDPATFEEYAEEKLAYGETKTLTPPLGGGADFVLLISKDGVGDLTPPFISNVQEDAITQRTATITWNTDEPATSQIEWGPDEAYGNFTSEDRVLTTAHAHRITGLSAETTWHYRVISRDANGNQSLGADRTFTTLAPDLTPPVISNVAVNSIAPTTASIAWSTDEPADSQIEYGPDANYGNFSELDANPVLEHNQTLTGLLPETLYHFRVISKDEDGNQSESADQTFTTLESPHYLQRVNAGSGALTSGDGRFWEADKSYFEGSWGYDGGGTEMGSTSDEILQTEDDALYQNYRFRIKNYRFTVPGSGTYAVELHFAETHYKNDGKRIFDLRIEGAIVLDDLDIHAQAGHDTPYVRGFDVEVDDGVLDIGFANVVENALISAIEVKLRVGDEIAPTISRIVAAPESWDRAAITWDTDQGADSQVEYGLDANYGSTTALDNTLVFMHSQTLENLREQTTYHYRVLARDGAGNLAVSGDMTFTTFPFDEIPPEISNVQLYDITETAASVTWDTDEGADSQVEHGLDLNYGAFTELDPALVLNHDQTVTGLEPNTTYHLRVFSKDLNGNQAVSADCVFTTLPDLTPPTISDVTITEVFEDSVTIPWTTDELADSQIEYGLDTNYGNLTPVDADLVLSHQDGVGALQPSTTYHYRVLSSDKYGNQGASEDFTFTTADPDLTPPEISNVQTSGVFPDSATIAWDTDEAANTYVEFGLDTNYDSTVGSDEFVTGHEQGLGGLLPETTYHYRVLSTDAGSNQAVSGDFTFTTAPEDQAAPVFSNVTAKNIAATGATIAWDTDEPGDSQVEYGLDTNYGNFTALDPALTTTHNQQLSNLQPATTYHYRVWSTDELGNLGVSGDFVFRTSAEDAPSYLQRVNAGGGDFTAPDGRFWAADQNYSGGSWGYLGSKSGLGDTNDPIANTEADELYQSNRWRFEEYRFTVENGKYFVQLHFCEEYLNDPGKRKFDVDIEGQQVINDLDVIAEVGHDAALVFDFETEVTDGRLDIVFRKVLENVILSGVEVRSEADGAAPVISNVAASNIGIESATISWNTDEAADSQVEFGLDANYGNVTTLDISLITSHSQQLTGLQAGTTYHYRTLSRDESGNLSVTGDFSFTTEAPDLTPPAISNVAAGNITQTTATITWNTDEASDSQVKYGIDTNYGGMTALDPAQVTTHNRQLSNLQPATTYHFRALSRDASGNPGQSADFTFTTLAPDETPPVISNVLVAEVFTDSVTVTWDTGEASNSRIEFGLDENYGSFSALDAALVTAHQHGVGGLTQNATYHFRVRSNDAGGNLAVSEDFTFTTLELDETPPVISNVASSNVTSTGASISWNTDEASDSRIEYGVSTAYGNFTVLDPNLVSAHSQQLSNLQPATIYHYRVLSSDESGNQAMSDDFTFTTPAAPQPSYEQRVNVGGGDYTGPDGRFWAADQNYSGGSWGYLGSRSGVGDTNDPIANTDSDVLYQSNRWRFDDYRFTVENGKYFVQLHFCEEYYNDSGKRKFDVDIEGQQVLDDLDVIAEAGHDAALVFEFETEVTDGRLSIEFHKVVENVILSGIEVRSAADTAPPQISNVAATEIGAETATISWDTSEPADSRVEFGLDASYGSITNLDPALVIAHSVQLTDLTSGATYHFRVLSKDESGNLATSGDFTFTTIIPDETPPVISNVVVTEIFPDSVTVTWDSDEDADSQIEFGLDASYGNFTDPDPALVQNHIHGVGGLISGTLYHFRVLSKDESANLATGDDLTFTTEEIDETPPVISNVQASAMTQSSATISWDTDEQADSQVEWGPDANYGNFTTLDPALVSAHGQTLNGLSESTTYHYRVHSRDASGNLAASGDFIFTTASEGNVAYANVQGVYDRNCVRCHSSPSPPADLDLAAEVSFSQTVNVTSTEEPGYLRVEPFDHVMSWLYEKISNPSPSVGSKMANLTDNEIDLIAKWIDQGAVQTPVAPFRALEFRTTDLPDGEINIVYSQQLVVWGGLPRYNFEIISGALPDGVVLGADGALTGTPTATGDFGFSVRVGDSQAPAATLDQACNLTIRDTRNSWSVPENFEIIPVVSDLHLPLNIAFIPNPGPNDGDPYFYVTLQKGDVVMVRRNYETTVYASGLLNFDPGETEAGLRGVVVDPNNGDVLVSLDYLEGGEVFSKITRLKSADGGRTSSSQEDILTGIPADYSHQIQALTLGADGLLYANVGDGQQPAMAPDQNDLRGKILRLNLDGSKPGDNPFADSYVYATGVRNPFGGAWRAADGTLYISDNGPDTGDRLVKIEPGQDHGWRLIDPDLTTGAIQFWDEVVVPGAVDFNEETPFDPQFSGWLFAALVGQPLLTGPDSSGKKIQAFELDANGAVISQTQFLDYTGAGTATVLGLAFGPDALYFTDLYGENGFDEFGKTHANIYRVRWLSDDTTPPVISNIEVINISDESAAITWQTDEPAQRQVEYGPDENYGSWTALETDLTADHSVTLTGLAPATTYHFRVWNWDQANNGASSGDNTFATTEPDLAPPVISNVQANDLTPTSATVAWDTDEAADSQIEYGLDLSYGSMTTLDPAMVSAHNQQLSNLQPATIYHYRVLSRDASGNLAASDDFTFNTNTTPSFARRVNVGGGEVIGMDGRVWSADQKDDGEFGYDGSKSGIGDTNDPIANTDDDALYQTNRYRINAYRFAVPSAGDYQVELHFCEEHYTAPGKRIFDVSLEGARVLDDLDVIAEIGHDVALVYTFETEVTDGVLDVTFQNVVENAMISGIEVKSLTSDDTPPIIANVQAVNITAEAATISWGTDEASDSQVEYGLDTNYGSMTTLDPARVTEHSQKLSDLQPETIWHFRVLSRDGAGFLAASGDFTFTTSAEGNVAFANIQSVFDRNCVRCHQGAMPPAGLNLSSGVAHGNIVNVPAAEKPAWMRVLPGDHLMSWLHEKITNPMPEIGAKMGALTSDEIALIAKWIDQGAAETPLTPFSPLEFRATSLPASEIAIAYDAEIIVWGGLPDYIFSITGGSLPPGVEMNDQGIISGTPAATGTFDFTLRVSDSQAPPATLDHDYTIEVRNTQDKWSIPDEFDIQPVVPGLHLPVNIAFMPNPGPNPDDPLFYVTQLYGEIVMVRRDYAWQYFATDLLNFEPTGIFPGSGELGVTGIVVDAETGDVFASMVYDSLDEKYSKIMRFQSSDGGRTASTEETILTGIPAAVSHQIHALTFGPDGLLYANVGDGFYSSAAPDVDDLRGKILRLHKDGSLPDDNPFAGAYVYAKGFRNPFGAVWRDVDDRLYISDNGPKVDDRIVKVLPGEDYGWGQTFDLTVGAIFLWNPTIAPVAMAFLGDTPFPAEHAGNLFVGLSGPAYAQGKTDGKKIQRFEIDAGGGVTAAEIFLDYIGAGKATVIGVAFGPDGLYFTDLYGENGFDDVGQTEANVYRVRWLTEPDTTAPIISAIAVTDLIDVSATVTWNTDEPAQRQIEYGADASYGLWSDLKTDLRTDHSVTLGELTPETIYHFRVWNWDQANNGASSEDQTFTTNAPDTTAPVISNVQTGDIGAHEAAITWDTDEPADSQIEYGPDANYGQLTTLDETLPTAHGQTLTGLISGTVYHFRVLSRDAAGNLAASGDSTFSTETLPTYLQRVNVGGASFTGTDGRVWDDDQKDNGDWGYDGPNSGQGDTNDPIANTDDDALYQTNRYRINAYRFAVPSAGDYQVELHFCEEHYTAPGKRIFDVSLEGTRVLDDLDVFAEIEHDAALIYTFETEVSDGVLDVTFQNVVENAMISGIEVKSTGPDLTPPAISSVASSNVTQTTATITWNTDEASDSQVEYGLDTNYGSATTVDPAKVTAHNVALADLSSNTTYHYRVKSRDASGNLATSGDFTFTTPAPDETPPAISNVAAQNITSTGATIVWDTDEAADSRVEYGLDANYGSTTTLDPALISAHSQQLSSLQPETTYHYRVLSRDAGGNLATSDDFTFTTLAAASWVQRVNVADGQYTGVDGRVWGADQEYKVGSWGYKGSNSGIAETSDPVANTEDDVLYHFNRYRLDAYRFTVPQSGIYSVQLHFAETYYNEAGKRKFDVDLEGQQVLNDLDIYAVAGHDAALVYNFDISVTDGVLDIDFHNVLENAAIHAIEVKLKAEGEAGKRVLLVGNSITDGVGSSDGLGFRPELYNMLASAGENVDFVGPEGAAPYEGHFYPGQNIEDFYPQSFGNGSGSGENDVAGTMDLYQPSIVMIHLGTNDLSEETNISPYSNSGGETMAHTTSGNTGELVNYILQWRDGTEGSFVEHIFVSQIIPRGDRENEVAELNDEVVRLIDDFAGGKITGQPEPVHRVDHYTPFDSNADLFTGNGNDYMAEDLHPNDRGYDVMAETYFDAYAAVIGVETAAVLAVKDAHLNAKDVFNVLGPQEFKLSQNYPNPFSLRAGLGRSQHTWIKFQLAKDASTMLEIYDILGRRVRTLVDEAKPAGFYQVAWNGRNDSGLPVSSGIYYYVLRSENFVKSLRMTVVR